MNHSLDILSSGVKFVLHLVHFMTNFELQLQKATKFFSYFGFSLLEWRAVKKNRGTIVDYVFTFWDIGQYYIFSSFEILHNTRTAHFLTNSGHGFAQRLFPQMYTAFKGIT